ncbi:MAG: hypothetical protein XD82_0838 [Methanoculleus marisnigri]|uniref:Uncharacterized protein n=1 Tax=Methanoculleus marisnigri TaxID=2198 RepID=A0A101GP67_9EURY|nr:MAG: hypothetical protein XD82_0838 [Methanoculleus marisnigri]
MPAFRFFFLFILFSSVFFPEAGEAYLQVRGARTSCCLRACGALHPGRQPGMGGSRASRDTGSGTHAEELNVPLYTFSVTRIYTLVLCRIFSPKNRLLWAQKRCRAGRVGPQFGERTQSGFTVSGRPPVYMTDLRARGALPGCTSAAHVQDASGLAFRSE